MQTSKKVSIPVSLEQSFALCELEYALTDGIFEPTRKIKNAHLTLREVIRETRLTRKNDETGRIEEEAITLTFVVPSVLNALAESILLAIIKMSGMNGIRVEPDQPTLPLFSTAEGGAKAKARVQTTCKQYQLLKEAGMSTGNHDYQQLDFYLKQMARVTIEWKNHTTGWRGACHLMEYITHEDGSLIIQLNWRLAGVVLGIVGYDYAVIDLNERHSLEKDASKTLHRWLSAHLWGGNSEYITYKKLINHIWTQEATSNTRRWRLHNLKHEVLPEIAKLDKWAVEMRKDGALITHHKAR